MERAPGRATSIGISLEPGRMHAAVLHGRSEVECLGHDGDDLDRLLARCLAGRSGPTSVVIDISRVLGTQIFTRPETLSTVTVVRVVPRPASDPALARHPSDVIERLVARRITVPGGHDLFGHELRPLDLAPLTERLPELDGAQPADVAVVAAGSAAQPRHEHEVADALQSALPRANISLGSEFGGQGLAAREATVVLNAALVRSAGEIIDRCEAAITRARPGVPVRVSRGDGGWTSASRMRALPVHAIGASAALQVLGAAALADQATCRVALRTPDGIVVGDVRDHLVAAGPHPLSEPGTELVVPTATLSRRAADAGPSTDSLTWPSADVPVVVGDRPLDHLVAIGAAVSRPMAWLDEIAVIESCAELERVRRDAVARATAYVTANGADPGSAEVDDVSTVAIPYSRAGTIRVRVRVAGRSARGATAA